MPRIWFKAPGAGYCLSMVAASCVLALCSGCQEFETIKRELLKRAQPWFVKTKQPFAQREGITISACSLYRTANLNSEVIVKLPAETPVRLVDKMGEWYRVRTRDGREGYVTHRLIGGEDMIAKTQELRRSIEGVPVQAEGVTKSKANFRLEAGRAHPVVEILPPGKKVEMYERLVTARPSPKAGARPQAGGGDDQEGPPPSDKAGGAESGEDVKKDVWYKVKIEDGRVGYVYTHNLKFTPPEDLERMVPFLRLLAWRTVNHTEDPDVGAVNNYVAAYAPLGKDAGCDYVRLYYMNWSKKLKRRVIPWQMRTNGVLPIGNYQYEGKPGFSVRALHPTKPNMLVMTGFVVTDGKVRQVSEEEIPNDSKMH
ncbi:MAG: SH3 domain-containing protein [Pseudomonadota bacterium]